MRRNQRLIETTLVIALICNIMCSVVLASAENWKYTTGTTGFQRQEQSKWCWVASARNMAVGRYTKDYVTESQSDVVKSLKGSVVNETADIYETSNAVDSFCKHVVSKGMQSTLTNKQLKQELNSGYPVLLWMGMVGKTSHAVVLFGYDKDSNQVHLYDPAGGKIYATFSELRNGEAFSGLSYIQTVYFC